MKKLKKLTSMAGWMLVVVFLAVGCKGIPLDKEKVAQRDITQVRDALSLDRASVPVVPIPENARLEEYLHYAMINHPLVQAAYYDWVASVERITIDRSLPDPVLSFQADIGDILKTVMPGLMQEFPGPGKLTARANVSSAQSDAKYFTFETVVLRTAFSLKRAYYQLWFLDENISINRQMLELLSELEEIARAQNVAGKVTLQDVFRAQIEQDQLTTEIENLEDFRRPLTAQLKGALGLKREHPEPPRPTQFVSTPLDLNGDDLLDVAFSRNPSLKEMEADVRMAEASIALATKSKVPDFGLGLMADVKASPTMIRPLAGMSLPIWRDKIAAEISEAQAAKQAAESRLTAEQITVTVDFAMKSYEYREVTRNLVLLENLLIPKATKSLEIARAGYLGGDINFFNLIDAERTLLNFQLRQVEERTRREIVLAYLSLTIAGIAPQGAPVLTDRNMLE